MMDPSLREPQPGMLIGGEYHLISLLGEGGMGLVYQAEREGQRYAVKIVREHIVHQQTRARERMVRRFLREARIIQSLHHQNLVRIIDAGTDTSLDVPYMVMELLDGQDLSRLLSHRVPLAPAPAVRLFLQACHGLAAAHEHGVVHRDIKPSNLFVHQVDSAHAVLKICDFGVAKFVHTDDWQQTLSGDLTRTTAVLGSPLYMSPEQARSPKDVNQRSDIWSLGASLYEALSGHKLWRKPQCMGDLIIMLCTEAPQPLHSLAPWLDPALAQAVHRALMRAPHDRFSSVTEFASALAPFAAPGPTVAMDALLASPVQRRVPRRKTKSDAQEARSREDHASPADASHDQHGDGEPNRQLSISAQLPGEEAHAPAHAPPAPASTTAAGPGGAPAPASSMASTHQTRDLIRPYSATETGSERSGWSRSDPYTAHAGPSRRLVVLAAAATLAALAASGGMAAMYFQRGGPGDAAPQARPMSAARVEQPGPSAQELAAASEVATERMASFHPLPDIMSPTEAAADPRVALGRMLFFDTRLSPRGHGCSTCHDLASYGVAPANLPLQTARDVPSVFNIAGHVALNWDGRAASAEKQVLDSLLSPTKMGSSKEHVETRLRAIRGYVEAFEQAFPDEREPVHIANVAAAIASFERMLSTPGRWDAFLRGDYEALTPIERVGFNRFVETGCVSCHFGPYVGASMFQKLGLVRAWPKPSDVGRMAVTGDESDHLVFKVPSLRNVAMTAPYLHDGSAASLSEAVELMANYQLGRTLRDADVTAIVAWLGTLTGELPQALITPPELPPQTP